MVSAVGIDVLSLDGSGCPSISVVTGRDRSRSITAVLDRDRGP